MSALRCGTWNNALSIVHNASVNRENISKDFCAFHFRIA